MTQTLIGQVEKFVSDKFPGSTLTGGSNIIWIDAKIREYISNDEVHESIVDRLCSRPTWMVSVNIDPVFLDQTDCMENRNISVVIDWNCTQQYQQYFAKLHNSFALASIPESKGGEQRAMYLIEPTNQIIVNVLSLSIYANDQTRIDELLEGIYPLKSPSAELKEFLVQAFPQVRRLIGAAYLEFHAAATRHVTRLGLQAVARKLSEHKCWLIASVLPQGLGLLRTENVRFNTDADYQQIVAEVTGPIDAEALLRTHRAPQTLALVDPDSGVIFSLPDRILYGTTLRALTAFVAGIESALEPR